jgi:hypothetical protein
MSQRPSAGAKAASSKTPALRNAAPVFAALGDETRLRLIAVLCAGGAYRYCGAGPCVTRTISSGRIHFANAV